MKKSNEWMSISDMMSGLMLIFLFVAVSFVLDVEKDKEKIKKTKDKITQIALAYQKSKIELNKDLHKEFDKDLKKWNAEITKDNSIIFNSPEVLFETGKSEIKEKFKDILNDFFPRFIKILFSPKYKNEIDEIRIEGHTSNVWLSAKKPEDIYLNNMKLSQERANSVLNYVYLIDNTIIKNNGKFLEKYLRANGMAYAKLKYKDLNNILFVEPIKKSQVQSMLELFDICYIGLQKENLFKYGVSPNKLFDYMYCAKPIIYAINSGEANVVKLSNCGISVEAQNSKDITKAILKLFDMTKEEKDKLGQNGKKYVLEHFTYEKLAKKFINILEEK